MKIAIDIDDTIANTNPLLVEYAIKYDSIYKEGKGIVDSECYKFNGMFDWTEEDRNHFFEVFMEEVLKNVEVKEDVVEVVKKLKEDGHEIIFITTRDGDYLKDSYKLTKDWLEKNNILYDVIVAGDKRKSDYVDSLGFTLFIDDSIKNCTKVHEKGVEVLLFNTEYNTECNDFKRVYSWKEIYDYIKNK